MSLDPNHLEVTVAVLLAIGGGIWKLYHKLADKLDEHKTEAMELQETCKTQVCHRFELVEARVNILEREYATRQYVEQRILAVENKLDKIIDILMKRE